MTTIEMAELLLILLLIFAFAMATRKNTSPRIRFVRNLLLWSIPVITFLSVFKTFYIPSESMEPSLVIGDNVLVERASYLSGNARRGDVIVFHPPHRPEAMYIKRIIGLPGDSLVFQRRRIVVYDDRACAEGCALEEDYIASAMVYAFRSYVVPEGEYFVLGDNRSNSSDSREWGTVPRKNIYGKVILSWKIKLHFIRDPTISSTSRTSRK